MRRHGWLGISLMCAAALAATTGCSAARPQAMITAADGLAASGGLSGSAIEVPGTAALNIGADASVLSVSCASAGNCAAGGYYSHPPGATIDFGIFPGVPQGYEVAGAQPFVASQAGGRWHGATRIGFPAALHAVGGWIQKVSCAAPGDCSAGGTFADTTGRRQVFAVSEVRGTWGTATLIPGPAGSSDASLTVMSCSSPGNCSAGGDYQDSAHHRAMFLDSEVNGTWGAQRLITSIFATHAFGYQLPGLVAMSCSSAGNCSAGGEFQIPSPKVHGAYIAEAFVISQAGGKWGKAIEVPGSATLNAGGNAQVTAMSCRSAGNCSAGGTYWLKFGGPVGGSAFVVSEVHGTWGRAQQVPGVAAIEKSQSGLSFATAPALSCSSAGNCSVGGIVGRVSYVGSQVRGTWHTASVLSPAASISQVHLSLSALSCGSAGNCSAAGRYDVPKGARGFGLFVAREVNGRWSTASPVPGVTVLTRHPSAVLPSLTCDPAGNCSGGGNYPDGKSFPNDDPHLQAFVVTDQH